MRTPAATLASIEEGRRGATPTYAFPPSTSSYCRVDNKRGEQCTAINLCKFVGEYAQKDNAEITPDQARFMMQWCLAAGQVQPGKNGTSSSLVLKMEQVQVTHTSPLFQKWAMQKLKHYLGDRPSSAVQIIQTEGMDGTMASGQGNNKHTPRSHTQSSNANETPGQRLEHLRQNFNPQNFTDNSDTLIGSC